MKTINTLHKNKMDILVKKKWEQWLGNIKDLELINELESMESNENEIEDCFYKDLEFGTGGLRGVIGAGTNRINIYTVAKVSQGYANYLNKNCVNSAVVIAYDSRVKSDKFAEAVAEVLAANGIHVYIFPELTPTPALSFAVRDLRGAGGVVITASHNPAKYNGYKIYGPDGCQITTQVAINLGKEIETIDIFNDVKKIPFKEGVESGKITYIEDKVIDSYISAVSSQTLFHDKDINESLSIVYTPLNGAGLRCVTRCLRENGFTNLKVVAEQEYPDGRFLTCPYPNPEIKESLKLGLRDAEKFKSDLLLATDPDCDRIGIAVRFENQYVLLSGNEVGMLLLDYICQRRIELNKMPEFPVMIKTIVSIDMAACIAEDYGVRVVDVLTGFKFIGEQIGFLEEKGEEGFILGFEESCGYLTGSYVRDKDAVGGALSICQMVAYYKSQGKNLIEILKGLYSKYGYCLNTLHSYEFDGIKGTKKMKKIMDFFRENSCYDLLGHKIHSVTDYKKSRIRYADGRVETISIPSSDVLKFVLEGNWSVVVRPSGTEPKLKMYYSVSAPSQELAALLEKNLVKEIEDKVLIN